MTNPQTNAHNTHNTTTINSVITQKLNIPQLFRKAFPVIFATYSTVI